MHSFRTRDGRAIVNQRCQCGHAQSLHGPRLAELPNVLVGVFRHGPCLEGECPCQRFSFKEFIYQEETT